LSKLTVVCLAWTVLLAACANGWEQANDTCISASTDDVLSSPTPQDFLTEFDATLQWSPNGEYYTTYEYRRPVSSGTVFDPEQGRSATVTWECMSGVFVGWTADSRYALFSCGDQYGNSRAYAFDTEEWDNYTLSALDKRYCGMSGMCKHGVAAIAPISPRVLLIDGTLIHLPDSTRSNILTPIGKDAILAAAWSPGETYLVFVAYEVQENPGGPASASESAMYLTNGDGAQVKQVVDAIVGDLLSLQWDERECSVALGTTRNRYVLDVAREQVRILPAP
jgi:hypothetical protein